MKHLLLLLCLIVLQLHSQTQVKSDISEATVFMQNAEITRDISTAVTEGQQELVLTGISTFIDPSSIQVKFNGKNSMLLSVKYERNYLLPNSNNPKIEELKASLEKLNEELSWVSYEKKALQGMEDILNKNKALGTGNASFTPAQVLELSNVYHKKFLEIKKDWNAVLKEEKSINESRAILQDQLNSMIAKFNQASGNIVLQIVSKTPQKENFVCTYMVNNAGWIPQYDLRAESVSKDATLNYKAKVFQNTGNDWNDVQLTVSTGNPLQNNNRPILNPLYANIQEKYELQQAYGYQKKSRSNEMAKSNMALEEVSNDADMEDDGVKFSNFKPQMSWNQLSVEFSIPDKKTILSDGKENLYALQSYTLPTKYIYHTVPKLNKGAFLLAKISDWSQYNLVYGQANIFFEGAFVGETVINPEVTSDTLLMSMGRDNSIVVERKAIVDFTSTKFIGANKKESYGFEFIIKNKKSVQIQIEILDQIPLSQNSDIEIALVEKGDAKYTEKIGKILWTKSIAPGAVSKEKLVYTVKYPKKESVVGVK